MLSKHLECGYNWAVIGGKLSIENSIKTQLIYYSFQNNQFKTLLLIKMLVQKKKIFNLLLLKLEIFFSNSY